MRVPYGASEPSLESDPRLMHSSAPKIRDAGIRGGALPVLALLAALLAPADARSHDLPRERVLLLQVDDDSMGAMLVHREPPGRRVGLLFANYDLDGDTRLTDFEANIAGHAWSPYVGEGLRVAVDEKRPERRLEGAKFDRKANGGLSTALLFEWSVEPIPEGDTRTVEVELDADAPAYSTLVRFRPTPALDVESDRLGPFDLAPGQSVQLRVSRRSPDD